MKTQTQLCMIWCSEPHSLLAKTSSSSPTSCEHRGHYCVRNINIFTLLSPSHHHRHHHHHQVTVNTIISHVTIILSSSAPSPSSRRPQDHHHHHLTSSPLLWHHHHCCDIITTVVTSSPLLWHHHHYCVISAITFILYPHPHHHHHQHHRHYPRGSESPWRVVRAFSTGLKGLFSSFLHPRRTVIWRMFSSGRWSILGGLKTRKTDDRMSLWDSL